MSLGERRPLTYWSVVAFACATPCAFLAIGAGAAHRASMIGMLCGVLTWILIMGTLTNRWPSWRQSGLGSYFGKAVFIRAIYSLMISLILAVSIKAKPLAFIWWLFMPDGLAGALAIQMVISKPLRASTLATGSLFEIYLITLLTGLGILLSMIALSLIILACGRLISKALQTFDRINQYIDEAYPS